MSRAIPAKRTARAQRTSREVGAEATPEATRLAVDITVEQVAALENSATVDQRKDEN
jgi:hypothetical protein